MSKFLEILGIAPVEETEEMKAVEAVKKQAKEKVEDKKAAEKEKAEEKVVDKKEAEEEENRSSFVSNLFALGKEAAKKAKETETDDDEVEEIEEDESSDEIDDSEPTEEEIAEFDAAYDHNAKPDQDYEDILDVMAEASKKADIKPGEPDRVSEDRIEEIKQSIENRSRCVLDILRDAKPIISEEEQQMEERRFYDEIGDLAYEYDRTGVMDVRLGDYIKRTAAKDKDLCLSFINDNFLEYIEKNGELIPLFFENYLEDIIRQNPDWISKLDEMIVRVSEDTMNIHAGYIRRVHPDGVVYCTLGEAKANIPEDLHRMAQELTLNEDNFFDLIWEEIPRDGGEPRRMTKEEVEHYVINFRGDKDTLAKLLHLTPYGDAELAENSNESKDSAE
ncbi:hypothetical protein IKW75_02260 [Candidatus Saccharibacteria bacterium]|nr:hypothetical protein [Candidatus Saccharibacteria bacterium]